MCEHFPESLTSALGESYDWFGACQVSLVIRKLPANAEDRQAGSVPGLGRSTGGGHGRPLQSPCLENLVDRGAWGATVHRVIESDMTEVTECSHAHNDWLIFQIHLPRSCQPEIWEPHRVTTDPRIPRLLCSYSSQAFATIYHVECFKRH